MRHDRHEYHRWSAPQVAVPIKRPEPKAESVIAKVVTLALLIGLWAGVLSLFVEV